MSIKNLKDPLNVFIYMLIAVLLAALLLPSLWVACKQPQEPQAQSEPLPPHHWHLQSALSSYYFYDTRTDMCYYGYMGYRVTQFAYVPCTTKLLDIAIKFP